MKRILGTLFVLLITAGFSFGNSPEKLWFGENLQKYDNYYLQVDDNYDWKNPNFSGYSYRFYDNINFSFLERSAWVAYPVRNSHITNKNIILSFTFNIKSIYISYNKNNEANNIIFELEGINNNELLYFKYDSKNMNNFPFLLQEKQIDSIRPIQLISIDDYKRNKRIEEKNKQKEFISNNFIGFGYMTILPNTYNRFNVMGTVDNFIINLGFSSNRTIEGFRGNDFNLDIGYLVKTDDILIGLTIGANLIRINNDISYSGFSGGVILSTTKHKVNPFIQLRSNGIYSIGLMF